MVKIEADPTDPPGINSSDPSGTVMNWTGWVLIVGVMFAMLATAQATVTPLVQQGLSQLPVINSGDGNMGIGTNGGGL